MGGGRINGKDIVEDLRVAVAGVHVQQPVAQVEGPVGIGNVGNVAHGLGEIGFRFHRGHRRQVGLVLAGAVGKAGRGVQSPGQGGVGLDGTLDQPRVGDFVMLQQGRVGGAIVVGFEGVLGDRFPVVKQPDQLFEDQIDGAEVGIDRTVEFFGHPVDGPAAALLMATTAAFIHVAQLLLPLAVQPPVGEIDMGGIIREFAAHLDGGLLDFHVVHRARILVLHVQRRGAGDRVGDGLGRIGDVVEVVVEAFPVGAYPQQPLVIEMELGVVIGIVQIRAFQEEMPLLAEGVDPDVANHRIFLAGVFRGAADHAIGIGRTIAEGESGAVKGSICGIIAGSGPGAGAQQEGYGQHRDQQDSCFSAKYHSSSPDGWNVDSNSGSPLVSGR